MVGLAESNREVHSSGRAHTDDPNLISASRCHSVRPCPTSIMASSSSTEGYRLGDHQAQLPTSTSVPSLSDEVKGAINSWTASEDDQLPALLRRVLDEVDTRHHLSTIPLSFIVSSTVDSLTLGHLVKLYTTIIDGYAEGDERTSKAETLAEILSDVVESANQGLAERVKIDSSWTPREEDGASEKGIMLLQSLLVSWTPVKLIERSQPGKRSPAPTHRQSRCRFRDPTFFATITRRTTGHSQERQGLESRRHSPDHRPLHQAVQIQLITGIVRRLRRRNRATPLRRGSATRCPEGDGASCLSSSEPCMGKAAGPDGPVRPRPTEGTRPDPRSSRISSCASLSLLPRTDTVHAVGIDR